MNEEVKENERIDESDKKKIPRFIGRKFKKEIVKQCTSYEDKIKEMQKNNRRIYFKLSAKEESKPHQISNSIWSYEALNKKIDEKITEKVHEKYQKIDQSVIFLDQKTTGLNC